MDVYQMLRVAVLLGLAAGLAATYGITEYLMIVHGYSFSQLRREYRSIAIRMWVTFKIRLRYSRKQFQAMQREMMATQYRSHHPADYAHPREIRPQFRIRPRRRAALG